MKRSIWKTKKAMLIALLAVVLGGGGISVYFLWGDDESRQTASAQNIEFPVKKGDLRSIISGTGQLEPQQLKMIMPPKEGMIKAIHLSRNQVVKEGELLLELSDSNLEDRLNEERLTLQELELDMQELQEQAAAAQTTAPRSGKLILAGNLAEGTNVSENTKIATIADIDELTVTLPFIFEEAAQLNTGDTVQLSIDGFMLTKTGVIESISDASRGDAKGKRMSDVTIHIENDGTMDAGLNARAFVELGGRKVESASAAPLQYKDTVTVLADTSGTIKQLYIKSDRMVKAGELIASIENDTLDRDILLKQAQIDRQLRSIEDLQTDLEKLKVYAPFDGIFSTDFADPENNILTSYTAGTTIKSDVKLGAVASLDTLQLPIEIDELDLPKIRTGLKAEVKVDAFPDKVFDAEVIQVSTVGTTTNGVTFYSAVLSIRNETELKYGMTATADIIVEDKKDVLVVPIEALQQREGKRTVTLKQPDGTLKTDHEVIVGANNDTMVEITEGLQEGDIVVIGQNRAVQNLSPQEVQQMRQQWQRQGGGQGGGGPVRFMGPGGGGR